MLRSLFFFFLLSVSFSQTICNIEDYGAKGNNRTVNTRHIQRAINSCDGIYIPEGIFLTGKLHLKSNFSVEISENGVLQGAPFHIYDSMIHAKGVNGLYFSGGGKIDSGVSNNRIYKVIEFLDCTNIRFQNFSIYQHNHDWCFLCENCSYLELDKFQLHGFFGRDGLDLVGCKHVAIHDSLLLGSDDALALKANTTIDSRRGQSYNSYNISVWNCEIASKDDNALQFGSETPGNFTGIFFRDIRISSAGKAGIGITSNDGGYISHVYYENIEMHNVATPFWIKITNRTLPIGMIHDIYIKNVTAAKVYGITSERNMTSTLDGFDAEHRVGPRIYFEDISITYVGGGSLCAVDIQPPNPDTDYRPRYLGPRPSYGFYIRHANEIQLTNVNVSFEDTDLRPPFYFDTVSNIILRNVEGELASGTLSNNCQIVVNETTGLVLESSSLTACEYADISPCPHQVYYYSPYDY